MLFTFDSEVERPIVDLGSDGGLAAIVSSIVIRHSLDVQLEALRVATWHYVHMVPSNKENDYL